MVKEIDLNAPAAKSVPLEPVLNIDALVKFGTVEKEVEPIPGWKVTMHVLSQEEREKVPSVEGTGYSPEAIKCPILALAITQINSETFNTPEQRDSLLKKLKSAPGTTIDLLYIAYNNLFVEQFNLLQDGIKKKL